MQKHNLQRKTKDKKSTSVGRGGKRGKTAGRGTKGQKARSGRKLRPEMRDIIKKLPKLRGYAFNRIGKKAVTLQLEKVAEIFENGAEVSLKTLLQNKLIKKGEGAKIVSGVNTVSISKKLNFSGVKLSESAQKAVVASGGEVK